MMMMIDHDNVAIALTLRIEDVSGITLYRIIQQVNILCVSCLYMCQCFIDLNDSFFFFVFIKIWCN